MKRILTLSVCWLALGCAASASTPRAPEATPAQAAPAAAPPPAPVASAPAAAPAPTPPPAADSAEALGEGGVSHHAVVQKQLGFYAVLTPPGYEAPENKAKRYPVVVILHGSGSDELRHGKIANTLGRQDVIYVLPRAPYPHAEAFAQQGKPGWTAWPEYPEAWGKPGSETFPKDAAELEVWELYADSIAQTLTDVRKRYRTKAGKVVLVGHSQGAAFAHLFATRFPWQVKAYFAYAGYYDETTSAKNPVAQLAGLKANGVVPMLVHYENDSVTKVDQTKKLDQLLTERKIPHTTQILPAGSHELTPEVLESAKLFVREHCCGETPAKAPAKADDKAPPQPNSAPVAAAAETKAAAPAAAKTPAASAAPAAAPKAEEPKTASGAAAQPKDMPASTTLQVNASASKTTPAKTTAAKPSEKTPGSSKGTGPSEVVNKSKPTDKVPNSDTTKAAKPNEAAADKDKKPAATPASPKTGATP